MVKELLARVGTDFVTDLKDRDYSKQRRAKPYVMTMGVALQILASVMSEVARGNVARGASGVSSAVIRQMYVVLDILSSGVEYGAAEAADNYDALTRTELLLVREKDYIPPSRVRKCFRNQEMQKRMQPDGAGGVKETR